MDKLDLIQEEVKHFRRKLKSVRYWNKRIIRANGEIDIIYYRLGGTSSTSYDKDFVAEHDERAARYGRLSQYDKINDLEDEVNAYRFKIEECRLVLNSIDPLIKEALVRADVVGDSILDIALDLNVNERSLYRRFNSELEKYFKKVA